MESSKIISASNLSENSAYSVTRSIYDRYESMDDKSTREAEECRSHLAWWERQKEHFGHFVRDRGKRYENCRFDNFVIENDSQQTVVDALKKYALNSKDSIAAGQNVLLVGPKGAGKDHLLVALAKSCFMQTGVLTHWKNGVDLLDQFHRDALSGHEKTFDPLREADILYISDPIPPVGSLSDSKQAAMFKIIDARYRHQKPVWLSMNVVDGDEAEQRMGAQTVDRLRHDALILFCNWPSFRKRDARA